MHNHLVFVGAAYLNKGLLQPKGQAMNDGTLDVGSEQFRSRGRTDRIIKESLKTLIRKSVSDVLPSPRTEQRML